MENDAAVIDLSKGRVISFRDRGFTYSYTFDRLAQKDWDSYFSSILITREQVGNEQSSVIDPQSGASELVRAKVVSVDGYVEGFTAQPGWKLALPVSHVRLVASLLMAVAVDDASEGPIDPFHQEVRLRCAWSSDDPGKMKLYTGLVHRFNPVTAEHERKLNRAVSESRVVGGSRSGKTVYPARQKALLAMYDDLIESVEGYAFFPATDDIKVAETNERYLIVREMDALHKVVAVGHLFSPVIAGEEEAEQQ